jgi:membrane fusion protein, multidrug efflux system
MPQTPSALQTSPAAPPKEVPPKPTRPSSSRRWLWLVVLLALGAVAYYYYWPKSGAGQETAAPTGGKGKGRGKGFANPNVIGARAQKGNIGVYISGLGAVTPIYTVTVKSRVDGQLMNVMFKEGQLVHQGDLLVEIDPRPYQVALDQAEGQLARDEALLKNSRVDLERYKILLSQQAIPQQQLATQEALVGQYEGTIKTDEANVESAKLNLVYAHITAPITGLIGLRLVDPGNIVHATDTNGLLVITQLDPISVIFTTAEDQLPPVLEKLHAGQKLVVEAWDREVKNKLAVGYLQTIDNEIDPTTGTLRLRAVFDNKDGKLFPSQFVNARMLVEEKRGITVLPNAAIQRNSLGTYVWLVKPDRTVTLRAVTTGTTEGDQTQVTSGVEPGDVVVMVGVDKLQDGNRVNVQIAGETPQNGDGDSNGGGNSKGGGRGRKKGST